MTYSVVLRHPAKDSGLRSFRVKAGESLLEAASRAGIIVPYSCKRGACHTCKARLVQGTLIPLYKSINPVCDIPGKRYVLTCSATASSDVILEVESLEGLLLIKPRTLPCRVNSIDYFINEVAVIKLRLPPNADFHFFPGQYIDLIDGELRRSYSIANRNDGCLPCPATEIELHVQRLPKGQFSQAVLSTLKPDDLLRFEGPFGSFFMRETDRPLVFIAGGTGFAPIQAMLSSLMAQGLTQPVYLYWGAKYAQDFYSPLPKMWEQQSRLFHYRPVVYRETHCKSRKGALSNVVLSDFPSMTAFTVYACGSNQLIRSLSEKLIEAGLPQEQFFSDIFIPSLAPTKELMAGCSS